LAACFASKAANRLGNAGVLLERLLPTLDGSTPAKEKPPAEQSASREGRAAPARRLAGGWLLVVIGFAAAAATFLFPGGWPGIWRGIAGAGPQMTRRATTAPEPDPASWPASFTNTLGMKLVRVPKGSFMMGSLDAEPGHNKDEGPCHEVTLTRDFWMGAFEVTQEEYQEVMQVNPSSFAPKGKSAQKVLGLDTKRFPVENVTREDAEEFCRRLSATSGERTAKRRYRLPTEAEWEYACRAGGDRPYSVGEKLTAEQANFDDERGPLNRPREVGHYPANSFGLYDMHGNVREWCADGHREDAYTREPRRDPFVPA